MIKFLQVNVNKIYCRSNVELKALPGTAGRMLRLTPAFPGAGLASDWCIRPKKTCVTANLVSKSETRGFDSLKVLIVG